MAPLDPIKILNQMTLPQKVGQMIIAAVISHEEKNKEFMQTWANWSSCPLDHAHVEKLIKEQQIGGVIFYGNNTNAHEQKEYTQYLQSLSPIKLFITLDVETALSNRLHEDTVTSYPCAMALGAIGKPELLYQLGQQLGTQLNDIGVQIAFTPVADANTNPKNPIIGTRSFGSDPKKVAECSCALLQGLQSKGIVACGKHFPGHGDTHDDSHEALPQLNHDKDRLEKVELYPFGQLIAAGVKSIMLAHLEVPALESQKGLPSSLSHAIVTALLTKKMGFAGLKITDALCMKGVTQFDTCAQIAVKAVEAGIDLLLCPEDPAQAIEGIVHAVQEGKISEQTINERVLKILQTKAWAFNHESGNSNQDILRSKEALDLQKKLFAQSMTLAKSTSAQPFKTLNDKKIAIIIHDSEEKNTFEQQIDMHNIPILSINRDQITKEIAQEYNDNHIIISIHTMNRDASKNFGIDGEISLLIAKLKEIGKQVSVILFGSPYAIHTVQNADTILVAYSNHTEAQAAAAQVVLGNEIAPGTLPITL